MCENFFHFFPLNGDHKETCSCRTIANIDKSVQAQLLAKFNLIVNLSERKSFEFDPYYEKLAGLIMNSEGFFSGLEPIEGAVQAVKEMDKLYDVRLCTSPLRDYRYCVGEKFQWVAHHLGESWTRKIIITKDKTIVRADYLIDDRQQLGDDTPVWEQIYFSQPYNVNVKARHLDKWENWRSLF